MDDYYYIIGVILIAFAPILGRIRRRSFKVGRDNIGNAIINGDVKGTVTQTVSSTSQPPTKSAPDYVSWNIGIIGVLIMAAGLAHDFGILK